MFHWRSHPPRYLWYPRLIRSSHDFALSVSWTKLAAWNWKFSWDSSSSAIRWTTRSWGSGKTAEIPIEFKGEEPSEKKEEEKHASVIDVISHNRRHRHKNPLASLAYSMCRYVFPAEKSFTFFLHFTFFSLSSSLARLAHMVTVWCGADIDEEREITRRGRNGLEHAREASLSSFYNDSHR